MLWAFNGYDRKVPRVILNVFATETKHYRLFDYGNLFNEVFC